MKIVRFTADSGVDQQKLSIVIADASAIAACPAIDDRYPRDDHMLSISAMILPTNDGFAGLDSLAIPQEAGTYIFSQD